MGQSISSTLHPSSSESSVASDHQSEREKPEQDAAPQSRLSPLQDPASRNGSEGVLSKSNRPIEPRLKVAAGNTQGSRAYTNTQCTTNTSRRQDSPRSTHVPSTDNADSPAIDSLAISDNNVAQYIPIAGPSSHHTEQSPAASGQLGCFGIAGPDSSSSSHQDATTSPSTQSTRSERPTSVALDGERRPSFLEKLRNGRRQSSTSSRLGMNRRATSPVLSLQSGSAVRPVASGSGTPFNRGSGTDSVPGCVVQGQADADPLFEERRRARRIIQDTVAQLRGRPTSAQSRTRSHSQISLNAPPSLPCRQSAPTIFESRPDTPIALQEVPCSGVETIHEPSTSSTAAPSGPARSSSSSSLASRAFAPLPRRSGSRSSSPGLGSASSASQTSGSQRQILQPGDQVSSQTRASAPPSHAPPAEVPTSPLETPSSAADLFVIPRRILVQGIVSSSPPGTPASGVRSSPSLSRTSSARPRSQASTPVSARSRSRAGDNDSGFWSELPSAAAADVDMGDSPSAPVPAAMNQVPPRDAQPEEAPRPSSTTTTAEASDRALQDQANLIGRLLSVAAAATAATLLPGAITVDGTTVTGFDDTSSRVNSAASHFPASNLSPSSTSRDSTTSLRPVLRRHASSDSIGTFRRSRRAADSAATQVSQAATSASPNSLQDILRNALASAFLGRSSTSNQTTPQANAEAQTDLMTASNIPLPQTPSESERPSIDFEEAVSSSHEQLQDSPLSSPALSPTLMSSPALAIPVAALRADTDLQQSRNLPAGSFERFLADLQSDVSAAILQTHQARFGSPTGHPSIRQEVQPSGDRSVNAAPSTGLEEMRPLLDDIDDVAATAAVPSGEDGPTAPTQSFEAESTRSRTPFSFFRSYRFPARPASAASADTATVSGAADHPSASPADEQVPPGEPASSARSGDYGDMSAGAASTASVSTRISGEIVPMLLVGVRTATIASLNGTPTASPTPGGNTSATLDDGSPAVASPSANDYQRSTRTDRASVSSTSIGGNNAPATDSHTFVLWILGGLYPAQHPLVLAPSLLGDDSMSYDELLRLSEALGSVKQPTVSTEDISQSDLKVVKSQELPQLLEQGAIRTVTAERCLICLEEYEDEEDVRLLKCEHCFHQQCVDKWMSIGANTCPACRSVGVTKAANPSEDVAENQDDAIMG